jgi:hypothetical protein
MLPPEDPAGLCRHDRAPLVRLGKVKHGTKVLYMLLCTECGFAVSADELRRLRSAKPADGRSGPPFSGYGWAAHLGAEAETADEAETM